MNTLNSEKPAGHSRKVVLIGIAGPFKGITLPLGMGTVSIGRESSNQLWTADPLLSRRHCLIVGEGEQFTIRDLDSRNGTLVNGLPVEQHKLCHQDQICLGQSVLAFLREEVEAAFEGIPAPLGETMSIEKLPTISSWDSGDEGGNLTDSQAAHLKRELDFLLEVTTQIGSIRDPEALQWALLGMIFDVVPADRGAILLLDTQGEISCSTHWDRQRGPDHPVEVNNAVLAAISTKRAGFRVSDTSEDNLLSNARNLGDLGIKSLLCVPLMVARRVFGAIYLDSGNSNSFNEHHLQMMSAVAGVASLALDNVRRMEQLQEQNRQLRTEVELEHNMVGGSPRMRSIYDLIRRVAPTDSTVLIRGESGTGKELAARAIHRNSSRGQQPFVAINCAAITESLLESELFGHEKGSFTGAFTQKKGKIEAAHGGTLFLDEVAELATAPQAKLLRVLQEREFERVGGTRTLKVDIRLIAATNRNLPEAVSNGAFRSDLYYRLNVLNLTLPPLRERREDIPVLADHFILKSSRKCRLRAKPLSAEAEACLTNYDWPGNVRELENIMERAVVLGTSETILPEDLPEEILEAGPTRTTPGFHNSLREKKRQVVSEALQKANGNYVAAAKLLQIHPNSLLRLVRNLNLKG